MAYLIGLQAKGWEIFADQHGRFVVQITDTDQMVISFREDTLVMG